jgi:hypothetical protein
MHNAGAVHRRDIVAPHEDKDGANTGKVVSESGE